MSSLVRRLLEHISVVKAPVSASAVVSSAAPVTLGRWSIHYDENIIGRKIIQANEDHCGCCVVPKKDAVKATNKGSVVQYEKTEEYLVPYVCQA